MSPVSVFAARHQQKGFTLVEILIALVLIGMLTSLLVSAVFFASRTRIAVEQDVDSQLQQQASYNRFEQTLKYCLPELQKEPVLFRGTPSVVECFSTQNLQGLAPSSPLNIRWTIQETANEQSLLKYSDQSNWDSAIQITAFPSKARFVFWDSSGKRYSDWQFQREQPRLIPRRITIELDQQPQKNGLWSATLSATPQPDLPPPTFLGTVIQ